MNLFTVLNLDTKYFLTKFWSEQTTLDKKSCKNAVLNKVFTDFLLISIKQKKKTTIKFLEKKPCFTPGRQKKSQSKLQQMREKSWKKFLRIKEKWKNTWGKNAKPRWMPLNMGIKKVY